MNKPAQPENPPPAAPQKGPGIPDGMDDKEAKGVPDTSRHETETAAKE